MIPNIPDLNNFLGRQAFGWTMDGTAVVLLVALLIPWLVLAVAAVADALDTSWRPIEWARAEGRVADATTPEPGSVRDAA